MAAYYQGWSEKIIKPARSAKMTQIAENFENFKLKSKRISEIFNSNGKKFPGVQKVSKISINWRFSNLGYWKFLTRTQNLQNLGSSVCQPLLFFQKPKITNQLRFGPVTLPNTKDNQLSNSDSVPVTIPNTKDNQCRLVHGKEGGNGRQGEVDSEFTHALQSTQSWQYLPDMSTEGTWLNNQVPN